MSRVMIELTTDEIVILVKARDLCRALMQAEAEIAITDVLYRTAVVVPK